MSILSQPFFSYRLRVFDQTYRVRLIDKVTETIDEAAMNSLLISENNSMKTLVPEKFKEVCPEGLDVILKCGIVGAARFSGMEQFSRIMGSDPHLTENAKLHREVHDFYGILNEPTIGHYPCVGVVFGKKCVPEQGSWLINYYNKIAGNFLRPPSLRHLAQQFQQVVMKDQAILAVHWRYDEDWFSLCRPAAANALSQEHRKLCTALLCLFLGFVNDKNLAFIVSQKLKNLQNTSFY